MAEREGQSGRVEAVTVNQRSLIDKILARYSTELTLFRELLQNADDAQASKAQIRFSGILRRKPQSSIPGSKQVEQSSAPRQGGGNETMVGKEAEDALSFTSLTICNNGLKFGDADWDRVKSIANGNPDETKVGFYGVGFFSVFSLADDPSILSGEKALTFFWKGDSLYVRHGATSDVQLGKERAHSLSLVQKGWTCFHLPVRSDPPYPVLPEGDALVAFFAKSLMFTKHLEEISCYMDGELLVRVRREKIGEPAPLAVNSQIDRSALPPDHAGRHPSEKTSRTGSRHGGNLFSFRQAAAVAHRFAIYEFEEKEDGNHVDCDPTDRKDLGRQGNGRRDQEVAVEDNAGTASLQRTNPIATMDTIRIDAVIGVHVEEVFVAAMRRVTKKNPPTTINVQLLYSVPSLQLTAIADTNYSSSAHLNSNSPLARDGGEMTMRTRRRESYEEVLQECAPHSQGYFFIGSGPTIQTTGAQFHCNGAFFPTMERSTLDMSDVTLSQWNKQLLWMVGVIMRLTHEHRCQLASPPTPQQTLNERRSSTAVPKESDITKITREGRRGGSRESALSTILTSFFGGSGTRAARTSDLSNKHMEATITSAIAIHGNPSTSKSQSEKVPRERSECEEEEEGKSQEERMWCVLASMAASTIGESSPMKTVSGIMQAGFFKGCVTSPLVWTSRGTALPSLQCRTKDSGGIYEFITSSVPLIEFPLSSEFDHEKEQIEMMSSVSVLESSTKVLGQLAGSTLGYLASFWGSSQSDAGNALTEAEQVDGAVAKASMEKQRTEQQKQVVEKEKKRLRKEQKETVKRCEQFVKELLQRQLSQSVNVVDLVTELQQAQRTLSMQEARKLLSWCLLRHRRAGQLEQAVRSSGRLDQRECPVHCEWCGSQYRLSWKEQISHAESQGMQYTHAHDRSSPLTYLLKCRCGNTFSAVLHDDVVAMDYDHLRRYPNSTILKSAKYSPAPTPSHSSSPHPQRVEKSVSLGSYKYNLPSILVKRILKSAGEGKFIADQVLALSFSLTPAATEVVGSKLRRGGGIIPLEVTEGFTDTDLSMISPGWLTSLSHSEWTHMILLELKARCQSGQAPSQSTPNKSGEEVQMKNKTVCSESDLSLHLAVCTSVIRILALAIANKEVRDVDLLMATMQSTPCIPVQMRYLSMPSKAYSSILATGGFQGLPIVAVYEAHEISNSSALTDTSVPDNSPMKGAERSKEVRYTVTCTLGVPTSPPLHSFYKCLGIMDHVSLDYIFAAFDEGTLGWSRQQVLHYFADMLHKLTSTELQQLLRIKFLPAMKIEKEEREEPKVTQGDQISRQDQSMKKGSSNVHEIPAKCWSVPSLESWHGDMLYLPSPEMCKLELPMVYALLEERVLYGMDHATHTPLSSLPSSQHTFFSSSKKLSANVLELLEKLGVRRHPRLELLFRLASEQGAAAQGQSGQVPTLRAALARNYLITNFSVYREEYNAVVRMGRVPSIIPCTMLVHSTPTPVMRAPHECFTNQESLLFGYALADTKVIEKGMANLLGVREHLGDAEIASFFRSCASSGAQKGLSNSSLHNFHHAVQVFECAARLLPQISKRTLQELQQLSFIPVHEEVRSTQLKEKLETPPTYLHSAAPSQVFLRTTTHKMKRGVSREGEDESDSSNFQGLFPFINFHSATAHMFLQAVGVRNEPNVNEVVIELSKPGSARKHFERLGPEAYLRMLLYVCVEYASVTKEAKLAMRREPCLIAVQNKPTEVATAKERSRKEGSSKNETERESERGENGLLTDDEDVDAVSYTLARAQDIYIADNDVYTRIFQPLTAPQEHILENMYKQLGSRLISQAVATSTKVSQTTDSPQSASVEKILQKRFPLLLFKRSQKDFKPDACQWLWKATRGEVNGFVKAALKMSRTVSLGQDSRAVSCQACANFNDQGLRVYLCHSDTVDYYELAKELCTALLRESSLHDNLLWSTIVQSSDEVLLQQGFPVKKRYGIAPAKQPTARANLDQPPTPPRARPPETSAAIASGNPTKNASNTNGDVQKQVVPSKSKTEEIKRSDPTMSNIPSAWPKTFGGSSGKNNAETQGDTLRKGEENGRGQTSRGQSKVAERSRRQDDRTQTPLVDEALRRRLLQRGVERSSQAAAGGRGRPPEEVKGLERISQVMDDVHHSHNLRKIPDMVYAGLCCYIEGGQGEADDASTIAIGRQYYDDHEVEAMAFGELLKGLAIDVFGLSDAGMCNIYSHFNGPTAAFNLGGILYFNLCYFVAQVDKNKWKLSMRIDESTGAMRYHVPRAAVVDWYGIMAHELTHNTHINHDGEFCNLMMMYMGAYFDQLHDYLVNLNPSS